MWANFYNDESIRVAVEGALLGLTAETRAARDAGTEHTEALPQMVALALSEGEDDRARFIAAVYAELHSLRHERYIKPLIVLCNNCLAMIPDEVGAPDEPT